MDKPNFAEQKLLLFQKIMSIENENVLSKLFIIVDKFIVDIKPNDAIDDVEGIDIGALSFEEWNKLFMQEKELKEYIPEYGMTLLDYRRKIFNAEKGKSYPISQFFEKLENYV